MLYFARERVACDARDSFNRVARRGASSSEEGREDPAVVSFDAVVGDDGLAAAAARHADEGAAAGERVVLAAAVLGTPGAEASDEAGELRELDAAQRRVGLRVRRAPVG